MAGGYDFNVALSGSSSATSGAAGDTYGDIIAGGSKLPKWFLPLVIGSFVIVAIVFLVRR